jgi:signal transduction histidine kinase
MDRLPILAGALRAVAEVVDLPTLHATIARTTSEVVGGFCGLALRAPDAGALRPAATFARDPGEAALEARWAASPAGDDPESAALSAALRAAGEPLGVLAVVRPQGAPRFAPDDAAALALLADHAALAIVHARLRAEVAARGDRLRLAPLAGLSHELRTPLNAIIGFSDLMVQGKAGPMADEHREFLGDILSSAQLLQQLIDDVLDLARVDSGTLELRPEPVRLDRVVDQAHGGVRAAAERKRIRIDVALDPAVVEIVSDAERLEQIVRNYAAHAIKLTAEGGRVTVRAVPDGADHLRIEFEDAAAVAPADLARLYPGLRQGGARTSFADAGVRLLLTRRIVEALGGTVTVGVAPGGGVHAARLPRRLA